MQRTSLQLTFHKRVIYLVANLQKVSDEVGGRQHRHGTEHERDRESVCVCERESVGDKQKYKPADYGPQKSPIISGYG